MRMRCQIYAIHVAVFLLADHLTDSVDVCWLTAGKTSFEVGQVLSLLVDPEQQVYVHVR